jgi:lysophospholipase L1-like esterase
MRTRLTLALGAVLASCLPAASGVPPGGGSASTAGGQRYVALGDSYTIGTAVTAPERWPNQLVARLDDHAVRLELVANLGVNGYTSQDVIDDELPKLDALQPELVSLLIGVNDVVQGVPEERFRANAARILDELVARVGATRIFVVSTPDYTVTPAGADYGDPATVSAAIRRYNVTLTDAATARSIAVVDIYDLSLRAADDKTLVAGDGLHPSGAQYALWVERIAPVVRALLGG